MDRRVDPEVFAGLACVTDWVAEMRRTGAGGDDLKAILAERKAKSSAVLQLRWSFDPSLGYPIEPFTVWVAKRTTDLPTGDVGFSAVAVPFGVLVELDRPVQWLRLTLDGPGGTVLAFGGAPFFTPVQATANVAAGVVALELRGLGIRQLLLPAGTSITELRENVVAEFANSDVWMPYEIVGLPGDGRPCAGTDLGAPQGMIANLTDPVDAALDRFRRGSPWVGWPALAGGAPVTPWRLAEPKAFLQLFWSTLLPDLVDLVDTVRGSDQMDRPYSTSVPTGTQQADLDYNPLRVLAYGASTDPIASLLLGFGTAYEFSRDQKQFALPAFLVTSTFVDTAGDKTEWAALIPGATLAVPPAAPASLLAVPSGSSTPEVRDAPYRPVVALRWQAPSPVVETLVGSHAYARRGPSETGFTALLTPRPFDIALQCVGATMDENDPTRRALSDGSYDVDPALVPNHLTYAVASQDIFGRWSPWSTAGCDVSEPAMGKVMLTGQRLDPRLVAPWHNTLTLDIAWDWTSRSPGRIEVLGVRYHQTYPGDGPATTAGSPPGSAGASTVAVLGFAGDAVTATSGIAGTVATVEYLSADSLTISATPVLLSGVRRYRLTITGLTFDYDAAGRWGLALWARAVEAYQGRRTGPWGTTPVIASTSDPRPPVVTVEHEDPVLASLRDAAGEHHADLSWPAMAGAVAYAVYTVSESRFRQHHGLTEAKASQTYADRLAELRSTFGANPDRRPWTKVTPRPIMTTSLSVTLPRGTKEIHSYVVLGVSAGEVESPWPNAADPLCRKRFVAFAAPQVLAPPPPQLEVTQIAIPTDPVSYAARVRIVTPPGPAVRKVDLHRVRVPEAAMALDTMGPPVSEHVWGADDTLVLQDSVPPSWKPVLYRAVSWGEDDLTRAVYGGRSGASAAREVIVPPPTPPDLSVPNVVLPTAGSANARLDLATTAPVKDTPLGPHRLDVHAAIVAVDGSVTDVVSWTQPVALSALGDAGPAAPDSGAWREATTAGSTPIHVLVRRSDATASIRARVRLTDPLGRMTERVVEVPPGSASTQPPDIVNPVLTAFANGWILAFVTSVPNSTPAGDFVLDVRFTPTPKPPARTSRATKVVLPFPKLPWLPKLGSILDSPTYVVPVAHSRRVGGTSSVLAGFRRPGRAVVTLIAPDGTSTSITRTIGEVV